MASSSTFAILWLDAHIGLPTECGTMKSVFRADLAPVAVAGPIDPIDQMICCIRQFGTSVIFAAAIDQALDQLEALSIDGKKIVLITSASLGRSVMPQIEERGLSVYWYYIFCGNVMNHVDWASQWLDKGIEIQMFDFEMTLLIRLSRDLSREFIEAGKNLLGHDPHSALRYFECARALAENAMERDTPTDPTDPHRPSTSHRQTLDGEHGLIEQAKQACRDGSS